MQKNDVIGKYKVAFQIQSNEYTESYRVTDEYGNKRFLKLFNLEKFSKTACSDLQEVRIVKELRCEDLLNYVDSGDFDTDGKRYGYLVCDFIVGESVLDKMKREMTCSVYETKQIVLSILTGLKFLHNCKQPIIHNNISHESVMIDMSEDKIKANLIGFSHATQYEHDKLSLKGMNPFFVAPELFEGKPTIQTDLYAVGALMYYMIFGIEPWRIDYEKIKGDDRIGTILKVRKNPLKIPNMPLFEMDENLLNIIVKALSQDASTRFQSADEFISALNGDAIMTEDISTCTMKVQSLDSTANIISGNGFKDVAGMDELKNRLTSEVINLIKYPEKYKRLRVKIPNGMLLYGPPGCGKTFITEKFAEELGWNYMYVHCSDVASPYIHGGQEKIAALFKEAKEKAPTILFLDEIDAIIADRSRQSNVSEYGEVNEFLTHLNNCADNQIFVIGATNNPKGIDSAALRSGRLDMKIYVPAPDFVSRKKLLELYLDGIHATDVDIDKLAQLTDGYVSKDISTLVNKAGILAGNLDKTEIGMDELLKTINNSREHGELPSVSIEKLTEHEKIRNEFEGKKASRPRVGFY